MDELLYLEYIEDCRRESYDSEASIFMRHCMRASA